MGCSNLTNYRLSKSEDARVGTVIWMGTDMFDEKIAHLKPFASKISYVINAIHAQYR